MKSQGLSLQTTNYNGLQHQRRETSLPITSQFIVFAILVDTVTECTDRRG